MPPKSLCDGALAISVGVEPGFEELLCEDACLGQTIHPLLYFDCHVSVGVEELV